MRPTTTAILALIALSTACASSQQTSGTSTTSTASSGTASAARPKRSGNVITQEELDDPKIVSRDAYTGIRMLRPNFFSYRGPTGSSDQAAGEVWVSHDYGPLMTSQTLKTHNTMGIVEVRFLNAEEAALRFGLNANGAPVIVLLHNKNQ